MNLKSAELSLESQIQMSAVNVASSLYKEIIIPALSTAEAKDCGNGHIELPKVYMQTYWDINPNDSREALDWCWDLFNVLSYGPLVGKKKPRTVCISNLGSLGESIASIRRMLLVQSPDNPRYMYGLDRHFLSQLLETSSLDGNTYKNLPIEEQINCAATLYRNLLNLILVRHPKTIAVRAKLNSGDMTLFIWGSFKK